MSQLVGIGAVIAELREEFPELSVSKVRFLEAQGLLAPVRTRSGYRKYSQADRDRLQYILRAQRDHFLPLKVIAEHLDAMERGLQPPSLVDPAPQPPAVEPSATGAADPGVPVDVRISEAELLRVSGLAPAELKEAQEAGFVTAGADGFFGMSDLAAATSVAGLQSFGLTVRHLRGVRLAAERQVGIIDQVVSGSRPEPQARAAAANEVAALIGQLAGSLVAAHVQREYGAPS
ncbi:MAG: MerR family transcriptional regulator [Actinobacteria bacterium]|nr:MAG: MerR family transcriptional regulator [Actinomycetota bacterium]